MALLRFCAGSTFSGHGQLTPLQLAFALHLSNAQVGLFQWDIRWWTCERYFSSLKTMSIQDLINGVDIIFGGIDWNQDVA